MFYELTTLSGIPLGSEKLIDGAEAWVSEPDAGGHLLGVWRSDIGVIGQVFVLRGFNDLKELQQERYRALLSANPFRCRDHATHLSMESYAGFSFLPPVTPRKYGGVFEFRTYHLKPGGLPVTLSGWEDVIEPAYGYTDHLVVNMYALDGSPRITHIWGFAGVDERIALRAEHYQRGVWPPKGGPEQILSATSTIAIANPGSPIS
jgi:hypothetical protein